MAVAAQPLIPPQNDTSSQDDFYVPAYSVLLKDQKQPPLQQDILSVTYNDSLTNVDSMDLIVNNWNPGVPVEGQAVKGRFLYSELGVFNPWQDIELKMGYYRNGKADLQPMLIGEIVTMSPNFPASGPSTLTVRALNILHQFRTQQKTLQFKGPPGKGIRDSEIAKQIVEDINKDVKKKLSKIRLQMDQKEIEQNLKNEQFYPYLEMHNQFPIVFLMQRSRDIGYDISIEDEVDKSGTRVITFHYRSSADVRRPVYTLEWGRSLISFQPSVQTARQVNAVTVRGWNVQTKKAIEQTATRADLVKDNEKIIAPEDLGVTENSLSQKLEIIVDRGFKDEKEAKNVAKKTLRQLAQGLVEAKGKTIGLPDLRAGNKINIVMAEKSRFNGMYQVTATTHTIGDSGYTTDFSARMEAAVKS